MRRPASFPPIKLSSFSAISTELLHYSAFVSVICAFACTGHAQPTGMPRRCPPCFNRGFVSVARIETAATQGSSPERGIKREAEALKHLLAAFVNSFFEHFSPIANLIHRDEIRLQEIENIERVAGDRHGVSSVHVQRRQ